LKFGSCILIVFGNESLGIHLECPYAIIFWPMTIIGFGLPAIILLRPIFGKQLFNARLAFMASIILDVTLWVKRFIIAVRSLLNPTLHPTGFYMPTVIEVSITLGTFSIAAFLYVAFLKLFPIIELDVVKG